MIERILDLISKSGNSDYSIEKTLRFTQGTISNWRRNKNKVSSDAIGKLARYFNVSADYLLCLTDEPAPLNVANIIERPIATLSPVLAELSSDKEFVNAAKLYNAVSAEYKRQICAYILGVASALDVNISQVLGR